MLADSLDGEPLLSALSLACVRASGVLVATDVEKCFEVGRRGRCGFAGIFCSRLLAE